MRLFFLYRCYTQFPRVTLFYDTRQKVYNNNNNNNNTKTVALTPYFYLDSSFLCFYINNNGLFASFTGR